VNEKLAKEIFKFIDITIETTGQAPSQREIAEGCYISKGTVSNYLKHLETLGWIGRHDRIQRNIYIKSEKSGQMFSF